MSADHCCGLAPDHDGCCAYFCSSCMGYGRTGCEYDDLGCPCGACDGFGNCTDCGGDGWFNDAGEPCCVTPDDLAAIEAHYEQEHPPPT